VPPLIHSLHLSVELAARNATDTVTGYTACRQKIVKELLPLFAASGTIRASNTVGEFETDNTETAISSSREARRFAQPSGAQLVLPLGIDCFGRVNNQSMAEVPTIHDGCQLQPAHRERNRRPLWLSTSSA